MPSDIMDQRRLSSLCVPSARSSFFSEEIRFPAQRQVGFWKPESLPDNIGTEGMPLISGSKSIASSPLEKLWSINTNCAESLEPHQTDFFKEQKSNLCLEHLKGAEGTVGLSMTTWKSTEHNLGPRSNLFVQPASLVVKENKFDRNVFPCENGLFSSSLPEIFNKKSTLSSNDVMFGQPGAVNPHFEEVEPFESMEELEAQTIGNLLPDDDDLLSGVIDQLEYAAPPNSSDDVEDDLFYSGGGLEIEANTGPNSQQGELKGPFAVAGEHPYGEHPSRTLFVRNINSSVEDADLRVLFERYGDIRALYTACKNHGFVMISYYDIRAACNAMRALQNKSLRHRKLDIHFSIPKDNTLEKDINHGTLVIFNADSSVSNDDLRQIFGVYGEIREIRENPHKRHHKFIEFYDIRAAEAAPHALNRSDIAGKQIKLEPSRPGGARRLMQQLCPELEHEEASGCRQQGSPPDSSPSLFYGTMSTGAITSNGLDNGAIPVQHSMSRGLVSPLVENSLNGISSSIPCYLSPPVGAPSVGKQCNQSGIDSLSHSLEQMNFGFQCMPTFHPHSLPEYHNGLASGIPFNSPSTMSDMALNVARHAEGVDNRHITGVSSAGLSSYSFERNEPLFGASGNSNCPLHGHQYAWSNSNSHHLPPGMMLPTSTSFVNNVPARPPSQLHGLPRAPSHILNTAVPLHHHHVGSAPTINPSLWDRRHAYAGDLTETSAFHPGSLGSVGLSASSTLHAMEFASHNMFPHVGGNCIEPSISSLHVGLPSPQQKYHMFHGGRKPMIPVPGTFDAHTDRARSRRSETSSNQADNKKQYELDIERIIREEDTRTTLMIKNIPNKYTSKMLLAAIDENHRGTYDFIYLPIDFKNKCNVGYAFINMTDPQQIIPFYKAFNGKKWEKFNSEKVASLAYARIQGKAALIAHFQNSSLMNEDKRCRPILFHSDGPNAGDQEPFPVGINVRSRSGRSRVQNNEDDHQDSPSNSANGEETSNGHGGNQAALEGTNTT